MLTNAHTHNSVALFPRSDIRDKFKAQNLKQG